MNRLAIKKCPRCGIGVLKKRNGKYGQFWGCNEYPNCRYTAKLDDIDQKTFEEKVADFMKEEHVFHKTNWEAWVNASSIGEAEFCPQSFYLRRSGEKPNAQAKAQMQRGNLQHARVSSDRRCYIATYAFGEDHPIVEGLRRWRDRVLMKSWYGRVFVSCYYTISPLLICTIGKFSAFNWISRRLIIKIAKWTGAIS
jgi:ssDNA-binding Zn-finger/Zn-ribbon topoisomerase 1